MKLSKFNIFLIVILLLACTNFVSAISVVSNTNNAYDSIPPEINNDYYDVQGSPHFIANLISDNVYSRGDDATLYINIVNDGKIISFETNDDNIEDDMAQYGQTVVQSLIAKELESDKAITTANSMVATLSLKNQNTPIEIKQKTIVLGSLSTGRPLTSPAAYPIKIYENATPGIYDLNLTISYNYQRDSAIIPPFGEVYYWNKNATQNLALQIVVDDEPYFKVKNTNTLTYAGDSNELKATYTNIGKNIAKECTARISVVDPFTTTDDQAYLGDMRPGESKEAVFKINVADDATPKNYSVNSEIKYKDQHDDSKYSNNLKIDVSVQPGKSIIDKLFSATGFIIIIALIGIAIAIFYMKSKKEQADK